MTTATDTGYAFTLSLPPAVDERLRRWTEATQGASWDMSGGHVTLARLTGSQPPESLVPLFYEACADFGALDAAFTEPVREEYWDKPGLEIVMLVGRTEAEVARVLDLRARLLSVFLDEGLNNGLSLMEGGPYRPHVTLTTGLPPEDARRLEAAASAIDLRFRAHEIVYWSGGETTEPGEDARPPWHVVERLLLL